jgi:hypothetical protein
MHTIRICIYLTLHGLHLEEEIGTYFMCFVLCVLAGVLQADAER